MPDIRPWLLAAPPVHHPPLWLGRSLHYQSVVGSTNAWAMEQLAAGAEEGQVFLTDFQTQGRGQQGAHWESQPAENLTLSILLRPAGLSGALFSLSKVVALGVHQAVASLLPGAEVQVKWPNDVLVNRKKVAGILLESQWEGSRLKGIVAGIGLNVNQVSFSEAVQHKASSLAREGGAAFDRPGVMWKLLACIEGWYEQLQAPARVDRAYLGALYGYQTPVPLRWKEGEGSFPVLGVNAAGHLAVQLPGGIRHFDLKEIEFLFP